MRAVAAAGAILLLIVCRSQETVATQTVPPLGMIRGEPTCSSCGVRLAQVAVLGDTAGDGELPRELRFATMDERGRYLLSFVTPDLPMVYSPTGQFLGRIGRIGRGPGEFMMPVVFHAYRDTVWLTDGLTGRITAMQAVGQEWGSGGTWTVPGMPQIPFAVTRLMDGSILYNAQVNSVDQIGFPLHLLRLDGLVRSFGALTPESRPGQVWRDRRLLAGSREGGAWVLHAARYELERYDGSGQMTARWRRDVPWFPPQREAHRVAPDRPPPAQALAAAEDSGGLVWLFLGVPDPRHREAFGPSPTPGIVDFRSYDRYFDTIIEVFDPVSGTIIASQRTDHAILAVAGVIQGRIHALSERRTEAGGWQIVVWEVELTGRMPGQRQ